MHLASGWGPRDKVKGPLFTQEALFQVRGSLPRVHPQGQRPLQLAEGQDAGSFCPPCPP